MPIKGLEGMADGEIQYELQNGAKFVVYQYCISILVMTFKRPSSIHFIKKDKSAFVAGLPYTAVSLLFGWWGVPWGPIYTIGSVFTNLGGGKDITEDILKELQN